MSQKDNDGYIVNELKCPICMEISKDAVESLCCHHTFCADCSAECIRKLNKCPICRKQPFQTTSSVLTRRIIANLPINCPDCGKKCERGNFTQHSQNCPCRKTRCAAPGCGRSFSKAEEDAFLRHLVSDHRNAVLANHERLFDTSRNTNATPAADLSTSGASFAGPPQATSALLDDGPPLYEHELTDFTVNRRGVQVHCSPDNGKFYCGERVLQCNCCDGMCGPNGGCNCPECMVLDMAARGLPRGSLVNRAGEISRRAPDGHYYCGNTLLMGPFQEPFMCHSELQSQCPSCKSLDLPYYRAAAGVENAPPPTSRPFGPPPARRPDRADRFRYGPFMAFSQQVAAPPGVPLHAMRTAPQHLQYTGSNSNSRGSQDASNLVLQQMMLNALLNPRTANDSSENESPNNNTTCRTS